MNNYELESLSGKIQNMRNLGNFQICRPRIVTSRTDAQTQLAIIFNLMQRFYYHEVIIRNNIDVNEKEDATSDRLKIDALVSRSSFGLTN